MSKKKTGDLLVEKGFLTAVQLEEVLAEQHVSGKRIGETLVERGLVTEDQLTETISERLSIPKISLESMVIDPRVVSLVRVDLARRYTLIPIFKIGNTITLAMADPLNIIAIDEIKYLTGCEVRRAISSKTEIKAAIDQYYSVADSLHQFMAAEQDTRTITRASSDESDSRQAKSPVMKLVDLIISKAVNEHASDIHIEPDEANLRIRYRISGVMREEAEPPKSLQNELISRIKVAANLDVSEKRLPQDGRFSTRVGGNTIDLRVSTLPTIHGEKIVIRILDRRNLLKTFDDLGFSEATHRSWSDLIRKPEGLILIAGPTSSGKTSTLYATLQEINSVEKNIITVEDPVEYSLPLINQIQINEKAGLTFPNMLRSILRQNPDIIMIGEIRDTETAMMAIRSALTGHLVFSTVHTNDAPSSIARLTDMGIEPYLVATALKGVLAQRLIRVNCKECTSVYRPSEALLRRAGLTDMANEITFRKGKGCPKCLDTGFKGQVGIFELLRIDPRMSEIIMSDGLASRLLEEGQRSGYRPLFETGLEKLANGEICLEELLKETSNIDESLYFYRSQSLATPEVNATPV